MKRWNHPQNHLFWSRFIPFLLPSPISHRSPVRVDPVAWHPPALTAPSRTRPESWVPTINSSESRSSKAEKPYPVLGESKRASEPYQQRARSPKAHPWLTIQQIFRVPACEVGSKGDQRGPMGTVPTPPANGTQPKKRHT